ncbi:MULTISPECIES: helix-turn-helix transcriptional regulator [Streptomyces]|uniref:helix-turn-helix transcriptional regulator n=1 Tax=Streptomyces TaxID=1883 RepID=UPI000A3C6250|nr:MULTISPECIES: helix-turn-helix transcriptional regulator [Streptomyces]QTI88299.1 helix-turn-helix transcriptional regulator [Streptomyces sp. AgN23]WTB09186.1 helix-turn-helix transcriptional regulator [Streptomyces antimycoticus]
MQIEAILPAMAEEDSEGVVDHTDVRVRALTAMHVLRELIPWDGYALSAWDAGSGTHRHVTLASEGYSPEVQDHMNDGFVAQNPGFQLLHTRVSRALRWSDLARDWHVKFASTYSAEEVLIPAGFKEGATMCLRLPDGRYTGALHVSWANAKAASDEARNTIERFRPLLATACDLLRTAHRGADRMGPDAHAVLVSSEGKVADMPGRSTGPVLAEGSLLRMLLARHANLLGRRRYLWADSEGACHRIETIPCRGQLSLVVEQQIPWPFGLSQREAQVLYLIAEGYSNPQIAAQLYISPRTVSTHVEHILGKLGCQSRAQLAAIAVSADLLLIEEALGSGL